MTKKSNYLIAFSILIAGLFIGGFLVLSSETSLADLSKGLTNIFKDPKNTDPKSVDGDNDGLPDYLEEIYHTNPNNPDTDGDTYLDGEEVMTGYDPLKSPPDDKITDTAANPRPKAGSLKGVNLTDELGKAVLENIKNSSPDISADLGTGSSEDIESGLSPQAESIVDNALAAALAKSPQLNFVPTLQDGDIKISEDDSLAAAQNYVAQVRQTISAKISFSKLEAEVMEESIQTKNYSALDQYTNGYLNAYKAIKEIPAPASWKEIHKKNLSLLLASANIFQTIKIIDEDPLRATLALQQYQKIVIPGLKKVFDESIKLIQGYQQQSSQPSQ